MQWIAIIFLAAVTLGVCYLVDKGFTKLFRSKPQHASGQSVRLQNHYCSGGVILCVLGIAAVFTGMADSLVLTVGGILLLIVGLCLIVYYVSFGIYYDADSFLLTSFGKESRTYEYKNIRTQQLYNSYGNVTIIELHMSDGKAVQVYSTMKGAYDFMDAAFAGYLRQTGKVREDCLFYDPDHCCWFPNTEE